MDTSLMELRAEDLDTVSAGHFGKIHFHKEHFGLGAFLNLLAHELSELNVGQSNIAVQIAVDFGGSIMQTINQTNVSII
jgi:hypothetical protein